MHRIIEAVPLKNFRLKLKFADSIEGTVDLSNLAGKGVFSAWNKPGFFNTVYIDQESHTVAWPGGIDLCPDSLYAEATGTDFELNIKKKKEAVSF